MKLLKNSTIIPLEGTMDSFTGGVFSSDGQFLEDSLLKRGRQGQLQKYTEYLHGTYIYGGCLFGHFGHFIWESLSRLYAIRQCKEYPILFITPNDKIFNVQKIFFETIGVKNELLLVKVSTSVENLIYSPPGSSVNPLFITDEQISSLKYFTFPKTGSRKIWLSRSKLKFGKIANEVTIETELKRLGYEIIYPETLPLREQIKLVATSDIVAGCDGSQFFTFLFSEKIYGNFFIFNRRKDIPQTIPYSLTKRNIEFSLHTFDLDDTEEKHIFYQSDPHRIINVLTKYK
jgi:hypothetical protein